MYKEKTLVNMILAFLLSIYMPTNSFASDETKSELNSEDSDNEEKSEDSDETADEEDSSDDEEDAKDSGCDSDNGKDSGSDEKCTSPDNQQSDESEDS